MAKLCGVTHQAKSLEKLEGMRNDRTVLGKLGQMIRPDGIRLDGLT